MNAGINALAVLVRLRIAYSTSFQALDNNNNNFSRSIFFFAGSSLSSREQACLDNCARRFLDTTQFVVKYFQSKAPQGGGDHFQ
jgi:hypothetical protein